MAYNVYMIIPLLALLLLSRYTINCLLILRFKRKHGCQPEPRIPQRGFLFGCDIYKIQTEAFKNKRALEIGKERYDKYGLTWSLSLMGSRFYNTIEVENLKTVLATNFQDFGLGGRREAFFPFLGDGIFTADGAQWEHSRSLIRPNFTRSQVADLNTFETHIQKLIFKIPRDGSTVDLQPLFFQLTLDSATEFLFGESVNSLSSTDGSAEEKFGRAFDVGQRKLGKRGRLGKMAYLFPDGEFDQACKDVHIFVDEIVRKALEESRAKAYEKSSKENIQSGRYTFLRELLKSTTDPKRLRDELLNVLLAGRDTTASFISNTFHVLVRRPDIWKKLKAEIDDLDGHKPDYDTLRNLKYLKWVLNESLRLYPVVPVNGRYAIKDTIIPRGGGPDGDSPLFIPKGDIVSYSIYALHRRTDVYGPDALSFRPERWAPSEGLRPGWAYLPFNGGPRICIGQQFALTEASYTIVRLMQEFAGMEDRDGSVWEADVALTVTSAKGVRVAVVTK